MKKLLYILLAALLLSGCAVTPPPVEEPSEATTATATATTTARTTAETTTIPPTYKPTWTVMTFKTTTTTLLHRCRRVGVRHLLLRLAQQYASAGACHRQVGADRGLYGNSRKGDGSVGF